MGPLGRAGVRPPLHLPLGALWESHSQHTAPRGAPHSTTTTHPLPSALLLAHHQPFRDGSQDKKGSDDGPAAVALSWSRPAALK